MRRVHPCKRPGSIVRIDSAPAYADCLDRQDTSKVLAGWRHHQLRGSHSGRDCQLPLVASISWNSDIPADAEREAGSRRLHGREGRRVGTTLGAQCGVNVKYYLVTDGPTKSDPSAASSRGKVAARVRPPTSTSFLKAACVRDRWLRAPVDESVVKGQSRAAPAPTKKKVHKARLLRNRQVSWLPQAVRGKPLTAVAVSRLQHLSGLTCGLKIAVNHDASVVRTLWPAPCDVSIRQI